MKKFFNFTTPYQFEWGDFQAVITIVNVALIMLYGLSVAWFGLAIGIIGLIRGFFIERKINSILTSCATIVLNIYFLTLI